MVPEPEISVWHFWKITEDAPDGVQIIDLDGRIIYSNRAVENIFGCSPAKFAGVVAGREPGFALDSLLPAIKESGHWTGELTARHKDGRTFPIRMSALPVKDPKGNPTAIVVFITDITRHKWAEEELKKHQEDLEKMVEERTAELRTSISLLKQEIAEREQAEIALDEEREIMRTFFDTSPMGIAIGNSKGFALRANRAFLEMLGYSEEELRSTSFREFTHPDDLYNNVRFFGELTEGRRESYRLQTRFVHKDGRTIWANVSVVAVRDASGEFLYNFVMVEDITERRRLEEELIRADKLESIGLLAGGIAHDFNNILTTILSNLSLAGIYSDQKEALQKRLSIMERATLRAQTLTRQLLTFSMGGAPLKKVISLRELLEEAVDFSLRGSGVKCELLMLEELWAVDVDEAQIGQVLGNLIINADQAMPEGGIITAEAQNLTLGSDHGLPLQGGRYVRLAIRDKGIGIPQEHISKIFDPFFTTKQRGSGLGLATSYSIIKRHEGHITVESRLGEGTTFYIYLPASDKKPHDAVPMFESRLASGRGRVLVMDDEADIRESLGDILVLCGYQVEFAAEGLQALELFMRAKDEGTPFDAVIMDLTIPGGMGGKETIRRLRAIDPRMKAIVSSGYSHDPVMSDYREFGFSGFLTKPYRAEDLIRVLEETLRKPG